MPFVSDRDFLQKRAYMRNDQNYVISYKSTVISSVPEQEKRVRANTIVSGYRLYPDPNNTANTYMEFLSQNDVKGKIPPKLINSLAPRKASEWIKRLIQACANIKESRGL